MKSSTNTASSAGQPGKNEQYSSDVVEVSLLLSRQQIAELARQAQRHGLTSAQFLRQYITSICQPLAESA